MSFTQNLLLSVTPKARRILRGHLAGTGTFPSRLQIVKFTTTLAVFQLFLAHCFLSLFQEGGTCFFIRSDTTKKFYLQKLIILEPYLFDPFLKQCMEISEGSNSRTVSTEATFSRNETISR